MILGPFYNQFAQAIDQIERYLPAGFEVRKTDYKKSRRLTFNIRWADLFPPKRTSEPGLILSPSLPKPSRVAVDKLCCGTLAPRCLGRC